MDDRDELLRSLRIKREAEHDLVEKIANGVRITRWAYSLLTAVIVMTSVATGYIITLRLDVNANHDAAQENRRLIRQVYKFLWGYEP
jgi:hypothetical protein